MPHFGVHLLKNREFCAAEPFPARRRNPDRIFRRSAPLLPPYLFPTCRIGWKERKGPRVGCGGIGPFLNTEGAETMGENMGLILILLLMEEKTDPSLLFALMYLVL